MPETHHHTVFELTPKILEQIMAAHHYSALSLADPVTEMESIFQSINRIRMAKEMINRVEDVLVQKAHDIRLTKSVSDHEPPDPT